MSAWRGRGADLTLHQERQHSHSIRRAKPAVSERYSSRGRRIENPRKSETRFQTQRDSPKLASWLLAETSQCCTRLRRSIQLCKKNRDKEFEEKLTPAMRHGKEIRGVEKAQAPPERIRLLNPVIVLPYGPSDCTHGMSRFHREL